VITLQERVHTAPMPTTWHLSKLHHTLRVRRGNKNSGMVEENLLSLSYGRIVRRDIDAIDGLLPESFETYQIVEAGDIVMRLTDLQNDKRSLRQGLVKERGIVTSAYDAIHVAPGNDPRFWAYALLALDLAKYYYSMGGGVRQSITFSDFPNEWIYRPDLLTQERIAALLDRETARIDDLIAKKGGLVYSLKAKLKRAISAAVTDGLNADVRVMDSGIDWIGKIPAHWRLMKLGYLGRCANGINIGGDAFGSGYPFISYGDVYKNRELPVAVGGLVQSTEADRKAYSVIAGDVLFTRTSETIEEVGFSSVCMTTIEDAVFAGFLIRFRPDKNQLSPIFSKYAFQHMGLRDYFAKEMNLITRASLSQDLLRNMPVPLPPLEEQRAIGEHLGRLERQIEAIIEKTLETISKLKERRAALITAAVTGRIDVDTHGKAGVTSAALDQIESEQAE